MTHFAATPRPWTVADLADLPDAEGVRYEIIDGELLVSTMGELDHQWVVAAIATVLNGWGLPRQAGKAFIAVGLLLTPTDDVIPDVIWVSRERERQIRGIDRKFHGAPELVVEVLSPDPANEHRDRLQKLRLYAAQGVEEYWIVEGRTQRIEVYRPVGSTLELAATLTATDTLTSPLLPEFACRVGDLFEPE